MIEAFGLFADPIYKRQRLGEVGKTEFAFEMMAVDDAPSAEKQLELIRSYAVAKRFESIDVDHRHVVRELAHQIEIGIDIDLSRGDARCHEDLLRLVAQRAVLACVKNN